MGAGSPEVSVVIPARNEADAIGRAIGSVLAQEAADLEVLVVDGASTDGTRDVVRDVAARDPRVRLLENPRWTIPTSLNVGLAAARGHWLLRVDAHATVSPGYVEVLVGHLRSGRWGGVGARKDAVAETPMGAAIALALGSRAGVGGSAYHWAEDPRRTDHVPYGAYPVELLRALGGWDERLEANEDYELDLRIRRAGHELLLDPSARIDWSAKESLGDLFRQYRRYGRGKADVARLHPGTMSKRHLTPPALVAALAASAVAAPIVPLASAAAITPYAAFLLASSAWIASRAGDPTAAPRVLGALAAMHVGWGLGFWQGRLAPRIPRDAAGTRGPAEAQASTEPVA